MIVPLSNTVHNNDVRVYNIVLHDPPMIGIRTSRDRRFNHAAERSLRAVEIEFIHRVVGRLIDIHHVMLPSCWRAVRSVYYNT